MVRTISNCDEFYIHYHVISLLGTTHKSFQTDLPHFPVLKGSVVGVYIVSGVETLGVIGNLFDIELPLYTQSRLCGATGNLSDTTISCIPLSNTNLALHMQMDIGK